MKLIDLNQQIFVPVVDETNGGMTVEMGMTVGEFFDKFCEGFKPKTIEAIPVEWLRKFRKDDVSEDQRETIDWMLDVWTEDEQNANDKTD